MLLCFGTYATAIKLCSLNGTSNKVLINSLIHAVDPDSAYTESDNSSSISRLMNCHINFHTAASEENSGKNRKNGHPLTQAFRLAQKKTPDDISIFLHNDIIPLLDEDKKITLVLIFTDIIKKDQTLKDNTKKFEKYVGCTPDEFCSRKTFNLEAVLAGLLLYTVIIGKNNSTEGKETIRSITEPQYLINFSRQYESSIIVRTMDEGEKEDFPTNIKSNLADTGTDAVIDDPSTYNDFGWTEISKELSFLLDGKLGSLCNTAKTLGTFDFIPNAMKNLGIDGISRNSRINITVGMLSVILRCAHHENILNPDTSWDSHEIETEIQELLYRVPAPITADLLVAFSKAASLDQLSGLSNQAFYKFTGDGSSKSAIAFSVLAIFFTDLYLILTRYAEKHSDMIRYKTNAEICQSLHDFHRHVSFHAIPLLMDTGRHRIEVCLTCDEANSHKAAALFINEFERALGAFEDIFLHIGLQLYYIRAKIIASGSDNIGNYNFEAYTPTLMPLLSGGHLYSSHLVFLRELIQNAIDSTSVRKMVENAVLQDDIKISMHLSENRERLLSLEITDYGTGMGKLEIERYLTSIGRSFYTAGDFKKMNLAYKPISSFGIGFLSCFLVCSDIRIRTCSISDRKSYELSIPNIEGCFFIEESRTKFPTGTRITMDMNNTLDEPGISLLDMLEYASIHFLDIEFDIKFSWNRKELTITRPFTPEGNRVSILNSDIAELTRQETHAPPCPFAFADDGLILEASCYRTFRSDWWNRYMKKQLGGIEVANPDKGFCELVISKHSVRKTGKSFFLFIPFTGNGDIPDERFDTVEDTFEYPYGMFITDLPSAGMKIRSESNGIRTYSGKLRLLNAGILIDDGKLEPIFGQKMRIYSNDTETAYNNVIINFPPDWIDLNVARERIIGISKQNICKEKFLKGIASATIKNLDAYVTEERHIPLIHIQEIASFVTVLCADLNNDTSGEGKKLLTKLKKKKFLLRLSARQEGICFELTENNGEDTNMKAWFEENLPVMPKDITECTCFPHEVYFRNFEMLTGKRRVESLSEMDSNFSEYLHIPDKPDVRAEHSLSILFFSTYLVLFPEERIEKYSSKCAHARANFERQLQKRYTAADFANGNATETVTFDEIRAFLKHLPTAKYNI